MLARTALFCLAAAAASAGGVHDVATLAEMNALAQAQEFFYIDNSHFTTLENLDDLIADNPTVPYQGIHNGGGALVVRPESGEISRRNLSATWFGPYINFAQGRIEDAASDYDEGSPRDFYGNPYLFYTPLGLLEPQAEDYSLRYYGDDFDRYAIVSLGADGEQSADDLIVTFGVGITVSTISSARATVFVQRDLPAPELEVRGYNLRPDLGPGEVLVDGVPAAGSIVQWTGTRVRIELQAAPADGAMISLRLANSATTRAVPVQVTNAQAPSAAAAWECYE